MIRIKRLRLATPSYNMLLLLVPLYLLLHRPDRPHGPSPTLPTLPIHQISLSPSRARHSTNVISSITLPPSKLLAHVATLPNSTILFLTAGCLTHAPNTRELLYLALLHYPAPAIVPYLPPPNPQTISHLLPIALRAAALQPFSSLQTALTALHPNILELPSARATTRCDILPAPLSRTSITNRSSRDLPRTLYGTGTELVQPPSISPIPYRPPTNHIPTVLFVMPWLQMGGSEQSMLQLAEFAKRSGFRVAVAVTQPFWGEVDHRLVTRNDWMPRAYRLTDHVLDLVTVAPYHHHARVLRYFVETLRPSFIITSNSRLFYQLLPFVRTLVEDLVIADYNHMVHTDWLGGGMPRYGANSTAFIDRHFAASDNVTDAIRGWVQDAGHDGSKARTCYIGADVTKFHTGAKKVFARRATRARLGIANDRTLILFAGRFVLDKGVDVVVELIRRLRADRRFAFLLVGSGGVEAMVLPLREDGRVVVKSRATAEEMANYYAAGDILVLPSVKEGIALVVYEALANGMLVVSTDVGGQGEVVKRGIGVLLERGPTAVVAEKVLATLEDVHRRPGYYERVRKEGQRVVRARYTTQRFCECVFGGLREAWEQRKGAEELTEAVVKEVARSLKEERSHAVWAWRVFPQSVEGVLTVAVMEGCGEIRQTAESVRRRFAGVGIVSGGSFEEVVEGVDTELVMIVPGGFVVDDTDVQQLANLVRRPSRKTILDMVGVRVGGGRVGRLRAEGDGAVAVCEARNVGELGAGVAVMKSLDAANVVQVGTQVLKLDWLDEVFVVRTSRLREVAGSGLATAELFVRAFRQRWNVGYVHDIVARSTCRRRSGVRRVAGVADGGECGLQKTDAPHLLKY